MIVVAIIAVLIHTVLMLGVIGGFVKLVAAVEMNTAVLLETRPRIVELRAGKAEAKGKTQEQAAADAHEDRQRKFPPDGMYL